MNEPADLAFRPSAPIQLHQSSVLQALLASAMAGGFAFALCRTLAETFPRLLVGLAGWPGTLGASVSIFIITFLGWLRIARKSMMRVTFFLPFLLPLIYVFRKDVNLLEAYTLLTGGTILAILLIFDQFDAGSRLASFYQRIPRENTVLVVAVFAIYIATLGRTVGQADTFEFQVTAPRLGIVHPTGYPLYILLGKIFSWLPAGSIAFRINLLSAVCATVAAGLVYHILIKLLPETPRQIPMLAALALALSPTFWSQAVEAEVYALNAMLVAIILWILTSLIMRSNSTARLIPLLFLTLGLGLANHLTIVILMPAILLALLFSRPKLEVKTWLVALLLLLAGLALYLYLPIRWPSLNEGHSMGMAQFVDWVFGGRFKGALDLTVWRTDLTRYTVIGRLVLDQWKWPGVALATVGMVWLIIRSRQFAAILFVTWLGYIFYGISYNVPDISVFIIPAHLIMALGIGCGAGAAVHFAYNLLAERNKRNTFITAAGVTLFALVPLNLAILHWKDIDRSDPNPLEAWGRYVLSMELDNGAAILADSEKIAPLYYLQRIEELRPDLEIMVLPDEAAYRTELETRIAVGQSVYLARYLPGLEGIYHLSSTGPLVKVSTQPIKTLPAMDERLDIPFGSIVTLLGYRATDWQVSYTETFHITLFWTANAPVNGVYRVQLRLADEDGMVHWASQPAHPAGNAYPTSAWKAGEIVPDAHQIEIPASLQTGFYQLQAALLLPFGDDGLFPVGQTSPWQAIGKLEILPPSSAPQPDNDTRIWLEGAVITGADGPAIVRPNAEWTLTLFVEGKDTFPINVSWDDQAVMNREIEPPLSVLKLTSPAENGELTVFVRSDHPMRCGWLDPLSGHCPVAQVEVQGAPLPEGAVNFQDIIGLLDTEISDLTLQPGGKLSVTFQWLAIAPMEENYTLFVHVLDRVDRIVGQVDTWPNQGTYPTSQWPAGSQITDHLQVPIEPDAAPGPYRLEIGWYLLGTMKRLVVLGPEGQAIDNRTLLEGLIVPE
ncbi:MAG: DUF2723 domain-containing protein [Anaerolineales bacterium]|nr:DUF2723 domain-containing protein [Anaerolineales bacterium]